MAKSLYSYIARKYPLLRKTCCCQGHTCTSCAWLNIVLRMWSRGRVIYTCRQTAQNRTKESNSRTGLMKWCREILRAQHGNFCYVALTGMHTQATPSILLAHLTLFLIIFKNQQDIINLLIKTHDLDRLSMLLYEQNMNKKADAICVHSQVLGDTTCGRLRESR